MYRANFGIFCSTPGIALSRSVGRKAAARMLLTGMSINAEEALQIGLVSKICKENELGKVPENCYWKLLNIMKIITIKKENC